MVAPFAGAWIEIIKPMWTILSVHSRSLRGSVDWNCNNRNFTFFGWVAPFAGAWIEIILSKCLLVVRIVAPFAGAWIEIFRQQWSCYPSRVAPFAGAWIEIIMFFPFSALRRRRSLRGSVDWNNQADVNYSVRAVAPFAGAWIEISLSIKMRLFRTSLPSRERGLKFAYIFFSSHPVSRSLRGSVDWNNVAIR